MNFAESFFARLFSRGFDVFTTFQRERPAGVSVPLPALTPEEARGAETRSAADARGRLTPRDPGDAFQTSYARSAAPLYRLIPEGLRLETSKLGGDGVLELMYVSENWWAFANKSAKPL